MAVEMVDSVRPRQARPTFHLITPRDTTLKHQYNIHTDHIRYYDTAYTVPAPSIRSLPKESIPENRSEGGDGSLRRLMHAGELQIQEGESGVYFPCS